MAVGGAVGVRRRRGLEFPVAHRVLAGRGAGEEQLLVFQCGVGEAHVVNQSVEEVAISRAESADDERRFVRDAAGDGVRDLHGLHGLVVVREILRVKGDALLGRVAEVHGDGDEVGLADINVQARKNRLDGIGGLPRLVAAELEHERLRLVARACAGDAERPAGVSLVAVPLRGDRAHRAGGIDGLHIHKRLDGEIAAWKCGVVRDDEALLSRLRHELRGAAFACLHLVRDETCGLGVAGTAADFLRLLIEEFERSVERGGIRIVAVAEAECVREDLPFIRGVFLFQPRGKCLRAVERPLAVHHEQRLRGCGRGVAS